jgi:hypothetical protein
MATPIGELNVKPKAFEWSNAQTPSSASQVLGTFSRERREKEGRVSSSASQELGTFSRALRGLVSLIPSPALDAGVAP